MWKNAKGIPRPQKPKHKVAPLPIQIYALRGTKEIIRDAPNNNLADSEIETPKPKLEVAAQILITSSDRYSKVPAQIFWLLGKFAKMFTKKGI